MIDRGTRVIRVSLRSDEGAIGDRGIVRTVYRNEEGTPQGYYVEWAETPARGQHMGYVAPVRIQPEEDDAAKFQPLFAASRVGMHYEAGRE